MPPHPLINGEKMIIGQQYGKTKLKATGSVFFLCVCGVFIDREMANEIEAGSVVLVSETAPLPNGGSIY